MYVLLLGSIVTDPSPKGWGLEKQGSSPEPAEPLPLCGVLVTVGWPSSVEQDIPNCGFNRGAVSRTHSITFPISDLNAALDLESGRVCLRLAADPVSGSRSLKSRAVFSGF